MLPELNYSAAKVSQTAIHDRRIELRGDIPVSGICPPPARLQQIFGDYLDYLDKKLLNEANLTVLGQLQEMLLELAHCIRSHDSRIDVEEYSAILERLSGIYAKGMVQERNAIYTATAADYADLIEAISLAHPTYDYSKMIGQLLFYMKQLFEQRKGGWITIYDHLRSMPDSIEILQSLKQSHFLEIQQWVEEGVEHLFQIGEDLYSGIEQLNHQIHWLEQNINDKKYDLSSGLAEFTAEGESTVISLEVKRIEKEIEILTTQKNELVNEKGGERKVLELVKENIEEFQDLLTNTKRAVFIELVYDSEIE